MKEGMYRRPLTRTWVLFALLALLTSMLACGHAVAPGPSDATKETINLGAAAPAPGPAFVASMPANEADLPIPIRADDPTRGNRNAFVTLVVFSDFQCPFCAKVAETLEQLSVRYGPDSLRIVFKHQPLPFHDKATMTAEVAANVMQLGGSTAFWAFHNIAFARQSSLSEQEAIAWAVEVGINEQALRANLAQHRGQSKVAEDVAIAKAVGVVGTPCSFVNGALVSGAQPLSSFVEVIDAELEKAKSLATRGVKRDAVYGRMLTTNLEAKEAIDAAAKAKKAERDDDDEPAATTIYKVAVGSAPVRGPATALVTIVEFSDFQCPYCSRVGVTLERIRKEYGDKVRFVWKDTPLPFHPRALPAANFARSAKAQKGNAGFWTAHDKLFAEQRYLEDADLEKLAKVLGLNPQVTMAAVRNNTFKAQIDADVQQGKSVGVNGTPHFVINGRRLVGAQPFEKFKPVIDQELARAEAMLKTGVARAALYDALTKPAP